LPTGVFVQSHSVIVSVPAVEEPEAVIDRALNADLQPILQVEPLTAPAAGDGAASNGEERR
jgi:hypothetical protein